MKDLQFLDSQLSQARQTSNDIEPLEREIRALKKQIDDLELHKIMMEQRYVEQNFLNDDYPNNSSYVHNDDRGSGSNESFHDDITRILNFKVDDKPEKPKIDCQEKYSPIGKPIELSPIKHTPHTPENIKGKRLFDARQSYELKSGDLSKQVNSSINNNNSKTLKQSGRRTPGRESKENISYLKNYQKKGNPGQSQVIVQALSNLPQASSESQNRAKSVPKNHILDLTKLERKYIDQPTVSESSNENKKSSHHARYDSIDSNHSYMNLPLQPGNRHSPKNVTININNISHTSNSGNSSLNNTIANYHSLLNQITTAPNIPLTNTVANPSNKITCNFPLKTIDEDQTSYRAALGIHQHHQNHQHGQNIFNNYPIQLATVEPAIDLYHPVPNNRYAGNKINTNKTLSLDTSLQIDPNNNSLVVDRKYETVSVKDGPNGLNFFRNYTVLEDQRPLKQRLDEYLAGSRASNASRSINQQKEPARRPRSVESHTRGRQATLQTEDSETGTTKILNNSSHSLHGHSADATRNKHRRDSSIGARQKSIFKFKLENCTLQDVAFFESVSLFLTFFNYLDKAFVRGRFLVQEVCQFSISEEKCL